VLAALFAVLGVVLWVLATHGIAVDGGYLDGLAWHSHEMLFGFVSAGMAGFLLTAVRNWTGLPTPTGLLLALLALLWLLGRVLVFMGPGLLAAIIDVLFMQGDPVCHTCRFAAPGDSRRSGDSGVYRERHPRGNAAATYRR
jgi:uncharacterized protein involved in response to NO